jgi:hypothetical protein
LRCFDFLFQLGAIIVIREKIVTGCTSRTEYVGEYRAFGAVPLMQLLATGIGLCWNLFGNFNWTVRDAL